MKKSEIYKRLALMVKVARHTLGSEIGDTLANSMCHAFRYDEDFDERKFMAACGYKQTQVLKA